MIPFILKALGDWTVGPKFTPMFLEKPFRHVGEDLLMKAVTPSRKRGPGVTILSDKLGGELLDGLLEGSGLIEFTPSESKSLSKVGDGPYIFGLDALESWSLWKAVAVIICFHDGGHQQSRSRG